MSRVLRGVASEAGVTKLVKDLVSYAEELGHYLVENGKPFKIFK